MQRESSISTTSGPSNSPDTHDFPQHSGMVMQAEDQDAFIRDDFGAALGKADLTAK
jgi:hypothetical protein